MRRHAGMTRRWTAKPSLAIERELGNREGEALTLAQTAILLGTRSDFDESRVALALLFSLP